MKRSARTPLLALGLSLTVILSASTAAFADAGSYLATRQAVLNQSFSEQAKYAAQTLVRDSKNINILETLISAKMSLGKFSDVHGHALRLNKLDPGNQLAAMVLISKDVKAGDWGAVSTKLENNEGISPLSDGLTQAWAQVGLGDMGAALKLFETATQTAEGFEKLGIYNHAVALAFVGDFEGALALLVMPDMMISEEAVFARVQILSQLERNDEARSLLEELFKDSTVPRVLQLHSALERGDTLDFDIVTSVQSGIAGVFNAVAQVVDGEVNDAFTLLYARIALELDSDHAYYAIFTANLLERFEHFDLATAALEAVSPQSPSFYISELARARSLLADGQEEAQIDTLTALAEAYPEFPEVFTAMGDAFRRQDKLEEAIKAYSAALELIPTDIGMRSSLLFTRGTTLERNGNWEKAEVDLRAALELTPGHPRILNYMGYSLLEMNTNLEEAMQMIRAAVMAQPDDGYITDSLAWGLYRLREYDEAVVHMEKAAHLLPVDPIINDHLGDIYWAVGRKREAEFQWRRSLSFEPEDVEMERIRKKLLIGLDQVLVEEGKEPTGETQSD